MIRNRSVQDLRTFEVPAGFRGRSGLVVLLWWLVRDTLFLCSPQPMYAWRRFLLRLFGAKIGKGVIIRPTTRITYPWKLAIGDHAWLGDFTEIYNLADVEIGHDAVVSQNSYLCTGGHDYTVPSFDIFAKPIIVEPEAWIAADVWVGPGVTVGRGAVVAARSTLKKDAPPMMILAGQPAKVKGPRVMQGDAEATGPRLVATA